MKTNTRTVLDIVIVSIRIENNMIGLNHDYNFVKVLIVISRFRIMRFSLIIPDYIGYIKHYQELNLYHKVLENTTRYHYEEIDSSQLK